MIPFFSRLSASLLLAALCSTLTAQQRVCLSVDNGPATGLNSLMQPAQLAARVEGVQVTVATAPGMNRDQASAAHEAAFVAAGFTTVRTAPNEFCVTSAPGGAPITRGLCYGTDDMGLDLDSDVFRLVPPPAGALAAKANGAVVPLPPAQQPPLPFGGTVTIYVWVEVNGVRIRICVQVQLQPNLPGSVLQQQMVQQLQQFGFLGHIMTVPNPLQPNQRMEVLQLERTTAGDPIDGIEFAYDALSRRIVKNVTGAGLRPEYGAYEYGIDSPGLAPMRPWSRAMGLPPQIDSFFDVFHQVHLPGQLGGFLLGTSRLALPVFNVVLLCDPVVIELGVTAADGSLTRHWVVPPSLALVGVEVFSQGFAVSGSQLTTSTGMGLIVGP